MTKAGDTQYGYFEPLINFATIKTVYISRNGGTILPSTIRTTSTKTKTKNKDKKPRPTTESVNLISITAITDEIFSPTVATNLLIKRERDSQENNDDDDDIADSSTHTPTATTTTTTTTKAATTTGKNTSISTKTSTDTSLPSDTNSSWGSDPNSGWGSDPSGWGSDPNGAWGGGPPGGPPPGPPPGWVYPNGTAMPPPPPPPIAPPSTPTKGPTSAIYTQTWSQSGTLSSALNNPTAVPIESSYKKSDAGAIAGGVIGGAALLAVLFFFLLKRKRRRNSLPSGDSEVMFETNPSHHWDSGNYRSDFDGIGARAFVPPASSLPSEGYIPDSPKPTAYYQSPLHTGTSISAYSPESEVDYSDRHPDPGHYTNDFFVSRYSDNNFSESTSKGATLGVTQTASPETDKTFESLYRDSLKPDARE